MPSVIDPTTFTTPVMRASYPHLVEPRGFNGGTPKYSVSLIADPGTDRTQFEAAIDAAIVAAWGKPGLLLKKSGKLRLPIHDNEEREGAQGYPAGGFYFTATSLNPVGVVSRHAETDGKPRTLDPEAIYPGCMVRAALKAAAYDVSGRGVTFYLNALQLIDNTTPRLDGRRDARDLFEALDFEPVDFDDPMAA